MLNAQGSSQKFNVKLTVPAATTGVIGDASYPVHIESRVRVENTSAATIVVEGSILGSSTWTAITLTSGVGDISTFDLIRFRVTVAGAAGDLIASGFISFF